MFDHEKLISLVHERRALWDKNHKHYHKRDSSRHLWNDIAYQMECTSQMVKIKWQNLRDIFRKEHMKVRRSIDGTSGRVSRWRFYKPLFFLANSFSSRRVVNNVLPMTPDNSSQDIDHEVDRIKIEESGIETIFIYDPEDPLDAPNTSSRNSETTSPTEEVLHDSSNTQLKVPVETLTISQVQSLEESNFPVDGITNNPRYNADEDIDEDYHFLMSLLPHLRDIPKKKKLLVRTKLQQVLINECN